MSRVLEVCLAIIGLLFVSPLFLLISLAIKADDGEAVFYRARRVGRFGREFGLFKFRTMVAGADKAGGGVTIQADPRITRVGQFLRRRKLDELPQLLNVLKGDMSFVGPRPEDPRYVRLYSAEQRGLLQYRPGITSPASLAFSDEENLLEGDDWESQYIGDILQQKLAIELEYIPRKSMVTDLKIVVQTLGVFRR